jgi:hypothetical protein
MIHISCGRQFCQCDFPEQLVTSRFHVHKAGLLGPGLCIEGSSPCFLHSNSCLAGNFCSLALGFSHRGRRTAMQSHCVLLIRASFFKCVHDFSESDFTGHEMTLQNFEQHFK